MLRGRDACVGPVGPVGPVGQVGCARLRPDGLRRGKSCDTPWVCNAAVWCGAGAELPQGYAGQLDGCGGVQSAGA